LPDDNASTNIEVWTPEIEMKEGPDIARIASLVGDPARANMLTALMGGSALTASELALEAGVTLPTASSHLGKLMDGGLLTLASQGVTATTGWQPRKWPRCWNRSWASRLRSVRNEHGPARRIRQCGSSRVLRSPGGRSCGHDVRRVCGARHRSVDGDAIVLGNRGRASSRLSASTPASAGQRRPMCRACLDWSVRRTHLAGTLGAAILDKIVSEKWARREKDSRAVRFTPPGRTAFQEDSSGRIMPEWKQKPGAMAGLFRASSAEIRLRRR
jgi:DNA-binding transcriptional ArsR family regulator